MDELELLRSKNPHIEIFSVHSPEFRRYGRVITADTAPLCAAVSRAVSMPEAGSQYVPSLEAVDKSPEADWIRQALCGGLDEQIGLCWGHSDTLNALEWHTCNEFNVAVLPLVLLLAKRSDMDGDFQLDSACVKAFYLAQGEMIEVYSDTLHFCPCQVRSGGFSCVVGLQRGTNEALEPERKQDRLWAKNKWLIAHEGNDSLVKRGAWPGIHGENWRIIPVDA